MGYGTPNPLDWFPSWLLARTPNLPCCISTQFLPHAGAVTWGNRALPGAGTQLRCRDMQWRCRQGTAASPASVSHLASLADSDYATGDLSGCGGSLRHPDPVGTVPACMGPALRHLSCSRHGAGVSDRGRASRNNGVPPARAAELGQGQAPFWLNFAKPGGIFQLL